MAICRYYLKGDCRYGQNCRFQHIRDNYNQNSYRFDGRQTQTQTMPTNRIGFSFNRTLENLNTNTNQSFSQQIQRNNNLSNFRSNETQMSSYPRNTFQLSNNSSMSSMSNQRIGFSFNKTLQQISNNDRQISWEPITEMESTNTVPLLRTESGSRESQPINFGHFSQSNNTTFFGNKSSFSSKTESVANSMSTMNASIDPTIKTSDDIYSKDVDLTQNDLKQFESKSFAFKSIPISPPTQRICF